MPHNPPNITGRKVRIPKLNIHNMIHRPFQSNRRPPLIPNNALRRTCRSRSVQNVEWIGAKHFLALDVFEGKILDAVGEPGGGTGDLVGGALVDEGFLGVGGEGDGLLEDLHVVYFLVGLEAAAGGDN